MYINIYLHDKAYGGPEEGGWYFDTYEPVKQIPVICPRILKRIKPRVEKVLENANKDRRHPSSVLSEGHFVCWVDSEPGTDYLPSERPYYG